jgi:PPOX class probable F420-dependent enzyme
VPIAYALVETGAGLTLYSALDEKRKSVADPRALARVRDIAAHPRVAVFVDRWDEDWSRLAWVRLEGRATVLEPTDSSDREHTRAVSLLRARYPQYARQALEGRPVIRIAVERVSGWSA